ncbi:MAG: hypothetical protein QOH56_846 [Pseudonocardiales bacterium]|nr:hypothetical protein [Pseudonocardiales bacterium]
MSARTPERDPRSPWVRGTVAMGAYMDISPDEVGLLLRSGELRGTQRKQGGHWRTHIDWMDAYLAGEEPPPITSQNSRR